jgi:hypothetical protein
MVTAVTDFSAFILYPAICSSSCDLLFLSSCKLFYISIGYRLQYFLALE